MEEHQLWGECPTPSEVVPQITRQMLDLKVPRPYILANHDPPIKFECLPEKVQPLKKCPYTQHSIYLSNYVNEANRLMKNGKPYNPKSLQLQKTLKRSGLKLSDKHSSEKKKPKAVLCPRSRKSYSHEQQCCNTVDEKAADHLTKLSVVQLALAQGFEHSQESAINILADVTASYIKDLCQSLRLIVDHEALTGSTGHYDCVDQLLHDYGIGGIQELHDFHDNVVKRNHSKLMRKAIAIDSANNHQQSAQESSCGLEQDINSAASWNLENLCDRNEGMSSGSGTNRWEGSTSRRTSNHRSSHHYINTFRPVDQPEPRKKQPKQEVFDY